MLTFFDLTTFARDVLMQLFLKGPTWDGNVSSKGGRDELVSLKLAEHRNGWAYLTREGVTLAISDVTRNAVRNWANKSFYRKITTID